MKITCSGENLWYYATIFVIVFIVVMLIVFGLCVACDPVGNRSVSSRKVEGLFLFLLLLFGFFLIFPLFFPLFFIAFAFVIPVGLYLSMKTC